MTDWLYEAFQAWFTPTDDERSARQIAAEAARQAGER